MRLKENVEDPQIDRRISEVLIPQEFTKLDGIIDLVFSTAEEVRQDLEVSKEVALQAFVWVASGSAGEWCGLR
jgi:hypothetical protein